MRVYRNAVLEAVESRERGEGRRGRGGRRCGIQIMCGVEKERVYIVATSWCSYSRVMGTYMH